MSLLIRNASYVVRDAGRVERDADVLIVGDRIAAVGQMAAAADAPDLHVLDGRDKAVIPGLVNAHTHLYQNFLKGLRDDVGLVEWCNTTLFPLGYAVHQKHWLGHDDRRFGRVGTNPDRAYRGGDSVSTAATGVAR